MKRITRRLNTTALIKAGQVPTPDQLKDKALIQANQAINKVILTDTYLMRMLHRYQDDWNRADQLVLDCQDGIPKDYMTALNLRYHIHKSLTDIIYRLNEASYRLLISLKPYGVTDSTPGGGDKNIGSVNFLQFLSDSGGSDELRRKVIADMDEMRGKVLVMSERIHNEKKTEKEK
jgi:hypothetical protein